MVPCNLSPSGPLHVGNGPMGTLKSFFQFLFWCHIFILFVQILFLGTQGAFTSWSMGRDVTEPSVTRVRRVTTIYRAR